MTKAQDHEALLVELLKKAQNRLRNQGDVPFWTLRANLLVHDEIERALGRNLFLADSYAPVEEK